MIFNLKKSNPEQIKSKNILLLYGDNRGQKNEFIKTNFKFLKENIQKIDENELLKNENSYIESLLNKSFFEEEKLIVINNATDKTLSFIELILEKKITDTKIILISGILETKNKLRKFFEKDESVLCIPFYPDDFRTLNLIASNFLKKIKISISSEALNLIIERAMGSRVNLENELKKIEMYLIDKKKIEIGDIYKLTNQSDNYDSSTLVNNILAKNKKKVSLILNENNYQNDDVIIILRTFLAKTKRILNILETHNSTKGSLDQTINSFKPPIFWKEKEIVKKQIQNWSKSKIYILIEEINELELTSKKFPDMSLILLRNFILEKTI